MTDDDRAPLAALLGRGLYAWWRITGRQARLQRLVYAVFARARQPLAARGVWLALDPAEGVSLREVEIVLREEAAAGFLTWTFDPEAGARVYAVAPGVDLDLLAPPPPPGEEAAARAEAKRRKQAEAQARREAERRKQAEARARREKERREKAEARARVAAGTPKPARPRRRGWRTRTVLALGLLLWWAGVVEPGPVAEAGWSRLRAWWAEAGRPALHERVLAPPGIDAPADATRATGARRSRRERAREEAPAGPSGEAGAGDAAPAASPGAAAAETATDPAAEGDTPAEEAAPEPAAEADLPAAECERPLAIPVGTPRAAVGRRARSTAGREVPGVARRSLRDATPGEADR